MGDQVGDQGTNDDERNEGGAPSAEARTGARQPRPRTEEHEVTHGARFRAGQDSVQVADSGVPASRAYGVEGATAEDAERD